MSIVPNLTVDPKALTQVIEQAPLQKIVMWSRLIREVMKFNKQHREECTSVSHLVERIQVWRKEKFVSEEMEHYETALQIVCVSNDENSKKSLEESFTNQVKITNRVASFLEKIIIGKALYDLSFQKHLPQTSGHKEIAQRKSPQEIASYAFAYRGVTDLNFFHRLKSLSDEEIGQLNAKEVAQLAYAYTCLKKKLDSSAPEGAKKEFLKINRINNIDFFEKLHRRAMDPKLLMSFKGKDIVRFTWAHAYARSHTTWDEKDWKRVENMMQKHCEKLVEPVIAAVKDLDISGTVRLCWSLCKVYRVTDRTPRFGSRLINSILERINPTVNQGLLIKNTLQFYLKYS